MSEEWHISEELCGRFLWGEVSKAESRGVVRHLVSGCLQCTELAHRLSVEAGFWSAKQPNWEQAYEEVFRKAFAFATEEERRIALERLQGWGQWAMLEAHHPQTRFTLVESDASYHTLGLYDRLLEASRFYGRREPAEAVDIVWLAILVAERLDPGRYSRERIGDLRASAWAELGNAKRLASDLEGARRAFNEAWRVLEEEGTNGLLEQAQIATLEASFIEELGEFETAEAALEEVLEWYRQLGDTHLQGRTLLKMGDFIGKVDPERGMTHIRKALALIEIAREPRLELCAQHDLAWFLNDSGQPEEALSVLDQARPLYKQFPDSYTQFRLHWLEAKISHNLGDVERAESILAQLWEEFRARDLNHELVLISIDLAETLVRKGEPSRAAELVGQCYPILEAWGLHRYALATWLFFQRAVSQEQAGGAFFRKIREYYLRHWVRPASFEV